MLVMQKVMTNMTNNMAAPNGLMTMAAYYVCACVAMTTWLTAAPVSLLAYGVSY